MYRMNAAKKRLQARLASKKKEDELHKWAIDKEYSVTVHDDKANKPDILLHPDLFKGIDDGEYIQITFISFEFVKLIFQISKRECLEKTKANISISKHLMEVIEKKYNFNPTKSKVLVSSAKKENYYLTEIEIVFKEYIPRLDIFFITQSILGTIVNQGQLIYNKKKKVIGIINKIEGSGPTLSGEVTEFTNFKMTTLASDIYLMIEISKSSYNYTQYFSPNYETTINHIKNILLKLKNEQNYHNIHIFFYSRIFFKGSSKYTFSSRNSSVDINTKKSHGFKFIRKDQCSENTYYFDIYDKIDTFNYENIDLYIIIPKIYKIFQNYQKIVEKETKMDLNEFLYSIRKNSENSEIFKNINYDRNSISTNKLQNVVNINKESTNQSEEDENNINHLSYTFDGFDNKECAPLDDNIFKDITDFEMGNCNRTGVFESVFFAVNQIDNNKSIRVNANPLVNVILSGESFPYYCQNLADKVGSAIHEESITLYFTMLCSKKKVKKLFKKNESKVKIEKNQNMNFSNDEYFKIDNFSCEPPEWCKKVINFIQPSLIYKHHYKYAEKYKVSILNNKTNNIKDNPLTENKFNHKINNFIINDYFLRNLDNNEVYLEILNLNLSNNNYVINNENLSSSLTNKENKKIIYDNIIEKYNIKKPRQNENIKRKKNVNENDNNDETRIKFIKNIVKTEKDNYKNCKNLKEKMHQYDNLLFNKDNKTILRKISTSENDYSKKIICNDDDDNNFTISSNDDEMSNEYEIGDMSEKDYNSDNKGENNFKYITDNFKDNNNSMIQDNASGIEYMHSRLRDDISNSIVDSESDFQEEFCYLLFIHLPIPYFFEKNVNSKNKIDVYRSIRNNKKLTSRISNNYQIIISGDEKKSKKINFDLDEFSESLTNRKSKHVLSFK